jgi:hypothetical protein
MIVIADSRAVSSNRLPNGVYYLVINGMVQARTVKLK